MSLEEDVLKRVVPSAQEETRLRETVEDVRARVALAVKAHKIAAEPLLVGSVAKGTHLSQAEIDIFVLFPRETPRETLERVGLALGEFLEDKKRMYAEHPYTRGLWKGFEVEVVPCYRIRDASEKMSAVDRTPLHARYVIDQIGKGQRDQVRLLKAFCEGVGVYGGGGHEARRDLNPRTGADGRRPLSSDPQGPPGGGGRMPPRGLSDRAVPIRGRRQNDPPPLRVRSVRASGGAEAPWPPRVGEERGRFPDEVERRKGRAVRTSHRGGSLDRGRPQGGHRRRAVHPRADAGMEPRLPFGQGD